MGTQLSCWYPRTMVKIMRSITLTRKVRLSNSIDMPTKFKVFSCRLLILCSFLLPERTTSTSYIWGRKKIAAYSITFRSSTGTKWSFSISGRANLSASDRPFLKNLKKKNRILTNTIPLSLTKNIFLWPT